MRARTLLGALFVASALGCGDDGVPDGVGSTSSIAVLDSLFDAAEVVYFSGAYDSAGVLLTTLRDRARREGALAAEARALTWVGLVAWRLGAYREATDISQEAIEIQLRNGLDDQVARSYNAFGLIAWMQDHLTESLDWYGKADAVATALGDQEMVLVVAANVAESMRELGRLAGARQQLLEVRELMGAVDNPRLQANVLSNLGLLEAQLGNPLGAMPLFREGIRRYREFDYQTEIAKTLGHLGTAYVALGQQSTALATIDSALVIARGQGIRQEEASLYGLMADVYGEAGDFQRSIDLYDRAHTINVEIGAVWETGLNLFGQADVYSSVGRSFASAGSCDRGAHDSPRDRCAAGGDARSAHAGGGLRSKRGGWGCPRTNLGGPAGGRRPRRPDRPGRGRARRCAYS